MSFSETFCTVFSDSTADQKPDCSQLQHSEGEKDQVTTQWGGKGPGYNIVMGKKHQATIQWGGKGPGYNTMRGERTRLQHSEGEKDQATTQWWEKGPGYNTVRGEKDQATTQWWGKRTVNARATLKHRPITFSKTFPHFLLSLFSSAVMTTTLTLCAVGSQSPVLWMSWKTKCYRHVHVCKSGPQANMQVCLKSYKICRYQYFFSQVP